MTYKLDSITLYNGRIDTTAIKSADEVDNFDFENMKISLLDIEDGLHQKIISDCWNQTPLHMAIIEKHPVVVNCFIRQAGIISMYCIFRFFILLSLFRKINTERFMKLFVLIFLIKQLAQTLFTYFTKM